MSNKTYYAVYKITNKINGKIYVGIHETDNLDGWIKGRKMNFQK